MKKYEKIVLVVTNLVFLSLILFIIVLHRFWGFFSPEQGIFSLQSSHPCNEPFAQLLLAPSSREIKEYMLRIYRLLSHMAMINFDPKFQECQKGLYNINRRVILEFNKS